MVGFVFFLNQWDQGLSLKLKVIGHLDNHFSGQEKELLLQAMLEKAPVRESGPWRNESGHRTSPCSSF